MTIEVDTRRLRHTDRADVWAEEFQKVVDAGVTIDEGLMVGWFANAIETTKDLLTADRPDDADQDKPRTQPSITEEEVEAAALAFIDGWAEDVNDVECPSWDERDDDDQAFWLHHMRAALEAAARIRTGRETA